MSGGSGDHDAAGCLLFLVWIPVSVLVGGWVLMTIWNWWIPTTTDLPELGLAAAIGVNFVRATFARLSTAKEERGLLEVMMISALMSLGHWAILLTVAGIAQAVFL